jgi:hypothetical protein
LRLPLRFVVVSSLGRVVRIDGDMGRKGPLLVWLGGVWRRRTVPGSLVPRRIGLLAWEEKRLGPVALVDDLEQKAW